MGTLLGASNVIEGDGNWSAGYQIDSVGGALVSYAVDVCSPNRTGSRVSGFEDGSAEGLDANIIAVVTQLPGKVRCQSGDEEQLVRKAIGVETEKSLGKALWGLTGNTDVSLAAADVLTVTAGGSRVASVGAALKEFWDKAVGVDYTETVLHLGVDVVLDMFGQIEGSILKNFDIKIASSAGYPPDGIAVTGPITVRLGSVQSLVGNAWGTNRVNTEANRLAALEFDPTIAVRVA